MTTPPPVMSRKTKKTKKKKKKEEKVAHADAPKLDWRVVDDVPAGFFFIFAIFFFGRVDGIDLERLRHLGRAIP